MHPIEHFKEWLSEAERRGEEEPTAMALATATSQGVPSVRMVLLKGVDDGGFVFYTNLQSPKCEDLRANPNAALCFHWKKMLRQVRVVGRVQAVSEAEADEYFASRPRLSQIGAWASKQSCAMSGAHDLERAVATTVLRFPVGAVPRPPFWSGFRLAPTEMEFWEQRPFRQHKRVLYVQGEGGGWCESYLFP